MLRSDSVRPLRFRSWFLAQCIVYLAFWIAGVVAFVFVTQSLDNDFAEAARKNHLDSIILVHLQLVPAYGVVALITAVLSYGLAAFYEGRKGSTPVGVRGRLVEALVAAVVIFVLSLGPASLLGPGSLDTIAHLVNQIFANFDMYRFYAWRLEWVFTGICALLFLLSLRAWASSSPGRRVPALFLVVSIVVSMVAFRDTGPPAPSSVIREASTGIRRPNILILGSDSLRYDHLSCNGYRRTTTPNIDQIADQAVHFDKMFVSTASTIESWASILTGDYPANHGLRYMFVTREQAERVSKDSTTVPRRLRDAGYHTAVVGDWAANCFTVVDFGFDVTATSDVQNLDVFLAEAAFRSHPMVPHYLSHGFGERIVPSMKQVTTYMNPRGMVRRLQSEFKSAVDAGKPFFGTLFVSSTHLPFKAPYPYNVRFTDPEYRGPNRYRLAFDVDDFIQRGFPDAHSAAEKQQVIDLYDGGVAHFDSLVGEVLSDLKRTGLADNTIVIILSDHGEDLYEPGTTLGHGTNFFGGDQANQIPFLILFPDNMKIAPRRISALTRNIDVGPTIEELAGLAPIAGRDGVSTMPLVSGVKETLDLAVFAETCYLFFPKQVPGEDLDITQPADKTLAIDPEFRNLFVLRPEYHDVVLRTKDRMMRTSRWKLIYIPGKHGPIWRFYDLSQDPRGSINLAPAGGAVFEAMKAALLEFVAHGRDRRWSGDPE